MSQENFKKWVDHIPVIWVEPKNKSPNNPVVIFLNHLAGNKEGTLPFLKNLASHGFIAVSFDAWQHGERGNESSDVLLNRVFSNFQNYMWPILGNTTLDTLKIIDWAVATFNVPTICLGGLSMGGDVSIACAGQDKRITKVVAVVATPDWLRPGMQDVFQPGKLLPPGSPDSYAKYFYDHLNPITHPNHYSHLPRISFLCGENDMHVPSEGAHRFQAILRKLYPNANEKIKIELIPKLTHLDVKDHCRWWGQCLKLFLE